MVQKMFIEKNAKIDFDNRMKTVYTETKSATNEL